MHSKTTEAPVFRYMYSRPRPPMTAEMGDAEAGLAGGVVKKSDGPAKKAAPATGAVHSAEIEYAMGNLATNKVFAWTPDDYKVSKIMKAYFANFIKTGNPNGKGLPQWPELNSGKDVQLMVFDVNTRPESGQEKEKRYQYLDKNLRKK